MTRVISVAVMVAVGSCLVAGDAFALSASYEQKASSKYGVFTSKVVVKDSFFRMESDMGGQTSVVVRNQDGIYQYVPSSQMAMKLPGLDAFQQPMTSENYLQEMQARHATLLRSETVNGFACDVYQFANPTGAGTTTAWVWKEKQFPVRMEMEGGLMAG